jgi:hypothetical protein
MRLRLLGKNRDRITQDVKRNEFMDFQMVISIPLYHNCLKKSFSVDAFLFSADELKSKRVEILLYKTNLKWSNSIVSPTYDYLLL